MLKKQNKERAKTFPNKESMKESLKEDKADITLEEKRDLKEQL